MQALTMLSEPFVWRALAGAVALSALCGPLGCFVAWRRMAFLGDTLAHASLLGIVLAMTFQISPLVGVLAVAAAVGLAVSHIYAEKRFYTDTLLGILAHGSLALGLVIISLTPGWRADISRYLFGDILLLGQDDVMTIVAVAACGAALLASQWRALMMSTLHPDIATVEGVSNKRAAMIITLLLACVIAISIKLVGILLITAMLIMPAAVARLFSATPSRMVVLSGVVAAFSSLAGVVTSLHADTPAGATIVTLMLAVFIAGYAVKGRA